MTRTIKFTAGKLPEFEIIETDAPDEVIEEQLKITCKLEEEGKTVIDAYGHIREKGYFVNLIGSHYGLLEKEIIIDKEFDYYDY